MSDPQDPLSLEAEEWRRLPHHFSCFELRHQHMGQIRTFLIKILQKSPLRVSDGQYSMAARFNLSRVPASRRSLVAVGRSFQIVARVNQNILSIWDLTLVSDLSDDSLRLRRRVALLLNHVSLE